MNSERTRRNRRWLQFETLEERSLMANYVVSTATDAGLGSLRQALLDANGNLGIDAISFAIGGGSKSIELLSELPSITESVSSSD